MRSDPKEKASWILASERGYSLIEILISVAIFAIGILGIAGLQIRATNADTHSRLFTEAYTVATDRIETIMLLPYSDAALVPGSEELPAVNTDPGNRYNLSYTVVNNAGPTPPNNTKTITVRVQINQSILPAVTLTFTKAQVQDLTS